MPERVTKLETNVDAIAKGIEDIKAEVRNTNARIDSMHAEIRQEIRSLSAGMDSRFDAVHARLDSWLKWVLGFIFSSWLTTMASLWLKR